MAKKDDMHPLDPGFWTIDRIRKLNINQAQKDGRGAWFGSDEIRFFNTTIESEAIVGKGGIFFVSGERYNLECPVWYTVRQFIPSTCMVKTVGEFQQYTDLGKALEAAKKAANP